jgi:hypothetical protein
MPTSNLLMDIEKAFNNQQLSDVVFTVEGKKIFANKFFLSLRCEKFRVQFGSKMSAFLPTRPPTPCHRFLIVLGFFVFFGFLQQATRLQPKS